jgi:polyisoprenoid-binding protein YceI
MSFIRNNFKSLFLVIFLFTLNWASAQEVYRVTEGSEFKVSGTSTLHDWSMSSSKGTGTATFELQNNQIQNIRSLHVTIEAKTLKSGKSSMQKDAYEALNIEQNPFIEFKMDRVIAINDKTMKLKGDFSAGGTTKKEIIEVTYNKTDGKIILTGSFNMSFSEYNITPPSSMGGIISSGDELVISFISTFKK